MGKPGLLAAPSSRGRCGLGEADRSPGLALVQDLAKLRPLGHTLLQPHFPERSDWLAWPAAFWGWHSELRPGQVAFGNGKCEQLVSLWSLTGCRVRSQDREQSRVSCTDSRGEERDSGVGWGACPRPWSRWWSRGLNPELSPTTIARRTAECKRDRAEPMEEGFASRGSRGARDGRARR